MFRTACVLGMAALFVGGLGYCVVAQDRAEGAQADTVYRGDLEKVAKSVQFSHPDGSPIQLVMKPIFSWSNPQRLADGGMLFLWTNNGRPLATLGIWRMNGPGTTNDYEFQSLSTERFQAKSSKLEPWVPRAAGVKFESLSNVPAPELDERRRQTQMRQIAREHFSAEIDPGMSSNESLRLIATPIYRYEETPEGILDGALFSFAQGTDPEVLLILEARKTKGNEGWFYAMAPSTSHAVTGKCKGEIVLKRARLYKSSDDLTYQLRPWDERILKD